MQATDTSHRTKQPANAAFFLGDGALPRTTEGAPASDTEGPAPHEPPLSLLDVALEDYFERHRLSAQQRRVLRLYLDGARNKAIAQSIGCSAATVGEHWRRILIKTSAPDRKSVLTNVMAFLRAHELLRAPAAARPGRVG
ncbi:MAG TPA: LuxR C-terminal-related transcriptional regulator [Polyangiaceae bacterium]